MSDFSEHHLITDLIEAFGSNVSLEDCMHIINSAWDSAKVHPQNSSLRVSDKHLQEVIRNSPNPGLFLHKYNELLEKRVDALGPFVEMMYIIGKDQTLKKLLKRTSKSKSSDSTPQVTLAEIPQLKHKLLDAVTKDRSSSSQLPHKSTSQESLEKCIGWIVQRPNMSWDFENELPQNMGSMLQLAIPHRSQENKLIQDLLYILMGIEGSIIQPIPITDPYGPREFTINQDIDQAYQDFVKIILPLASHYSIIQRFTEERFKFEYGQVNHALVAAMNEILKDYLYFVCALENEHRSENVSLQKMWFYVQRNMLSMSVMADIASTIGKAQARGGTVLTLLHNHATNYLADVQAHALCVHLTQRAAKPYMKMLSTWIFTGVINDPFKEFLIEDHQVVTMSKQPINYADDFWEKRYSVCRDRTPAFLEKVSDVILRTGKYLIVVRQCGKSIELEQVELEYHPKDQKYVQIINKAYFTASHLLQELLMQENDLIGRLRSVKRYFLLEQGDFIIQFMDLCEKELSKDRNKVVMPRLEALFELALRISVANNDLYKDDMRIELLTNNLQSQMFKIIELDYRHAAEDVTSLTGLESFSFGYEVKWPVSLVLQTRAVACYQMIFRHLFYCKHVERQICRVWICNKAAKVFSHRDALQYRGGFVLRQRMLNCVQNLEYHMMVEVIEPNWQAFQDKVSKLVDIDEVLKCHNDFLDVCLADCMLTNPDLLRTVTKLLQICVDFCSFIQSAGNSMDVSMSASMSASMIQSGPAPIESSIHDTDTFEQTIKRFDTQFSKLLLSLMKKISQLGRMNTNDKLVNLLYRLDFNSFYGAELDQLSGFDLTDVSG